MSDLQELLNDLARDPIFRRAFAAAPAEVLRSRGYDLAAFTVPEKMDLNVLEERLQAWAGAASYQPTSLIARPAPEAGAVRADFRRRYRLGQHAPAMESAPAGGLLSMTSAIAPFAEPSLPEGAEERAPARSGAKGKAKSSPKAESSEHASASYPSAWFGTYGTAVSRAIVSGKEAARWVPETIIDTDDRVLVRETNSNPFRWLCRLVILASNGTRWSGTGWLIGPNVVMTAGHCVYMQNQGGWAQRIQVFCYNDAGELSNATEAEEAATVDGWMANANPEDDYAVISLPKGGEPRGWFGFANLDDGALMRAVGNIAGFPVDKPVGTLWGHARRLSQVRPNALFYDIDTYGGMSGAPVICWNGQDYIVVGIHNYGDLSGNRATRINSVVCQNMEAWLTDYA